MLVKFFCFSNFESVLGEKPCRKYFSSLEPGNLTDIFGGLQFILELERFGLTLSVGTITTLGLIQERTHRMGQTNLWLLG